MFIMKQKYLILKDTENKQIKIQEFAELEKDSLSLLCEEAYDFRVIKSAAKTGKDELISALRTKNLYPPGSYALKIADAVVELAKSKDKVSVELFFDDIELLAKGPVHPEAAVNLEEESTDLDELLEENYDDPYEDKDEIKTVDSSLKIEDEDFIDLEDES
jgi:hypothetical protein